MYVTMSLATSSSGSSLWCSKQNKTRPSFFLSNFVELAIDVIDTISIEYATAQALRWYRKYFLFPDSRSNNTPVIGLTKKHCQVLQEKIK